MLDEEVKENQLIAAINTKKARRRAAYKSVISMAVLVGVSIPIIYSDLVNFTWFLGHIVDIAKVCAGCCIAIQLNKNASTPPIPQPLPQAEVPAHIIEIEGKVEGVPTGPFVCLSPVLSSKKSHRL